MKALSVDLEVVTPFDRRKVDGMLHEPAYVVRCVKCILAVRPLVEWFFAIAEVHVFAKMREECAAAAS